MANEKFYFIFSEKPYKKVYIDEPDGWGSVDHNFDQKENGHGRDETLSGGEFPFSFNDQSKHALPTLLYYYHKYKSQAKVFMYTVFEDNTEAVQQIHFPSVVTDDLTYFKCKMIVKSSLQIVKRRNSTPVDLFSSLGVNREAIDPVKVSNMLLKAKPSIQTSIWEKPDKTDVVTFSAIIPRFFNPGQNLIQSEIEDSSTFFRTPIFGTPAEARENFVMITAASTLKNVNVLVKNLKFEALPNTVTELRIYVNETATTLIKLSTVKQTLGDINFAIPQLNRGDKLSMFFIVNGSCIVNFDSIKITSQSTAYNTTTQAVRLIDAIRQVVKSISGLSVYAPHYDLGGRFYDTFLTNGKLLSGINDKPFYLSLDDIEKSIKPEHNADTEIDIQERVFVGIEKDFYTDEECWVFNDTQFDDLTKEMDPMYMINEFRFSYDKYQSKKENIEDNSASTIHGESVWTPINEEVENKKECKVKWSRDAVLLDVQQRLSTKISKDTATQEDDTIFAIDTVETQEDQKFTESTALQHTYSIDYLSVRNDGSVNFLVLGIKENTTFSILYPDKNAGEYNVLLVSSNELQLSKTSGGAISSAGDGMRPTRYTYEIKKETIPITNRTNQGFVFVNNLISPEEYSNLRYSIKRNIINNWNSFLATVNDGSENKSIINTMYVNNGECETEYAGLRVKENESFTPDNQIVTPFIYRNVTFANIEYSKYIQIQNSIKLKRGFIRCKDNNNRWIRLYHKNMSYVSDKNEIIFTGAEKYEKSYMTIVNEANNILINNETRLVRIEYKIIEDYKVAIFDKEKQRLYDPVYWDKITINGNNAKTLTELENWLKILE